jgi:hypothetical protein
MVNLKITELDADTSPTIDDLIVTVNAPGSSPVNKKLTLEDVANLYGTWSTWNPTLSNITKGSGTIVSRYIKIGKIIIFRFIFTLAADSAIGTAPNFSLPVTAYDATLNCRGQLNRSGNTTYPAIGVASSATGMSIFCYVGNQSYIYYTNITATVPWTWTTNDSIWVVGEYEAA